MRCTVCKGMIASGIEARKMIVEYTQPDGTTKIFGYLMADGVLSDATGKLARGWHHKCYHVQRKRSQKGDAVTGRALGGAVPTGYDAATADSTAVAARVQVIRATARRLGKGVGDAAVMEAVRADERGGPYAHTHDMRLEIYQLRAHLLYAHGVTADRDLHARHNEVHARAALDATRQARDDDPDFDPPRETDWHEQLAVEVADLHETIGG